jgi:pSer/pThr/pTyr-binding forkhead associated (FHA) protein
MIQCPACDYENPPGTLFCNECGVYLPAAGPLTTGSLPDEELPASQADLWTSAGEDQKSAASTTLRITVLVSGRQIELPIKPEICLGRLDDTHGVFPDLDLTDEGALERGVSRRHARIHYTDDCFLIEDVGSANGTFLNGKRLAPYTRHPLQTGDELQVGKLKLIVEFER